MTRFNGNSQTTGTGNSTFYAYCDLELRNFAASTVEVWCSLGVYVSRGNFYGTIVNTSWGKSGSMSGKGQYLVKAFYKLGTFKYGQTAKASGSASYTGANGHFYKSTVSASLVVPYAATAAPAAPVMKRAARVSDKEAAVAWELAGSQPYEGVTVERSTDGGPWAAAAALPGSATSASDPRLSPGHRYRYRVTARNSKGSASSAASAYVDTTPTAPSKVTAARVEGGVALALSGLCASATAMEWQYSADKAALSSVQAASSLASATVDVSGAGTLYFRCRWKSGALTGPWSAWSDPVALEAPPYAPTLLQPVSSAVVSTGDEAVVFRWAHNPKDGSAQTAAQVRWTLDEEWEALDVAGDADEAELANSFPPNTAVVWSARTKGLDPDFGPWAGNRVLYVRRPPEASVISPGPVVDRLPFALEVAYSDASGELADARAVFTDLSTGEEAFALELGTSLSASIDRDMWLPEDGRSYEAAVECRSTSGLTASASMDFEVAYIEPKDVALVFSFGEGTGSAVVSAAVDHESEGAEVETMMLWRIAEGREVLLASDLSDGGSVTDRWCPLNVPMTYRLAAFTHEGSQGTVESEAVAETSWAYFYHGADWQKLARCRLNPSESTSLTRPGRTLVEYAGRRYPVLYDDGSVSDSRTFSAAVKGREEAEALAAIVREGGVCAYKSLRGDVFCAAVDMDLDDPFKGGCFRDASISLTRIEGDLE